MLRKLAMTPFECAAIQPMGWLAKQLQLQAEGLCGNLDLVWPDVRDSAWLGGQSEGWERVIIVRWGAWLRPFHHTFLRRVSLTYLIHGDVGIAPEEVIFATAEDLRRNLRGAFRHRD